MYRLVAYTQYMEDDGYRVKPKGGDTYLVANLTLGEVVNLGQKGMAKMVDAAAASGIDKSDEHSETAEWVIGWDILAPGEKTQEEGWEEDYGPISFDPAPKVGAWTRREIAA